MKKIAVFMIFGQSNATGHGVPMQEQDYILEPLKNVYGLNREPNQSFDIDHLEFSGYTSFGMNLAETQDNTYSVPNQLARAWQDKINEGASLPDLYIVQISIGSQGLYGMWDMNMERVLVPGVHGTARISLYPFTIHILKLLNKYFKDNELEPDFVGMHWRGGEQETDFKVEELVARGIKNDYIKLFSSLREALGYNPPLTLHRMPFEAVMLKNDPSGEHLRAMHFLNDLFEELASEIPSTTTFEPKKCPFYNENEWDFGIFRWDLIHYSGKMNTWVAEQILNEYISR